MNNYQYIQYIAYIRAAQRAALPRAARCHAVILSHLLQAVCQLLQPQPQVVCRRAAPPQH